MADKHTIGVLVMAYGTPEKKEQIETYYTAIRHGRKPEPEQLANLIRRYEAIGGLSPLARITGQQAGALEKCLNKEQDRWKFKTYLGFKYVTPYIEEAVRQMQDDGISNCVALVLAPHYSAFSVQGYIDRAFKAARQAEIPKIFPIQSWYRQPLFLRFWAKQLRNIVASVPLNEREKCVVIFSAHSLPERILQAGDPYPQQVADTGEQIARLSEVTRFVQVWQSAGRTRDKWLGPDILDQIRSLHLEGHYKHYIFCPVGFVAEHLEVLDDNDRQCRGLVESLGGVYHRPPMPDTDPLFIEALASAVREKAQKEIVVR